MIFWDFSLKKTEFFFRIFRNFDEADITYFFFREILQKIFGPKSEYFFRTFRILDEAEITDFFFSKFLGKIFGTKNGKKKFRFSDFTEFWDLGQKKIINMKIPVFKILKSTDSKSGNEIALKAFLKIWELMKFSKLNLDF